MSRRQRVVLVAGTSGGVGATTVTALLFSSLGAPELRDHTGGDLGARLTGGDDVPQVDSALVLHDLGPHARGPLLDRLEEPGTFGVVVAPTTPAGFAAAEKVLADVRDRHGAAGLRRVLVALVGVFGSHPTSRPTEALENGFGRRSVVVIPRDAALAAGGRVPLNRLSRDSRRAQRTLSRYLEERLHNYTA
ncbi:MAG: hypothetical protein ABWZ77_03855 [Naasia sp.]